MRPKKVILCVDDNEQSLSLRKFMLETRGYRVLIASSGREAIDVFQQAGAVDLVLADLLMPEMDGVAALREIRRKTSDLKVLISSGYTSPEKAPVLESLGIDGFVQKPFELVKLASTVRDVLDGVTVS